MIDLKRNLFKIDVRAQKDEEKVFMRTACLIRDYSCFLVRFLL
ncbi:exfoliative toxin [Streptococcus pyogenes]|nr:exfoliative toxin [Streptococcus pyogenes]VGU06024.1 exfoliative toxin [Streptococcus pyogenes]